ncbi:MAG: type IV pili methyl-accepting chemotaxis transducer N-terminal domain-containing protein [Roseobacter sp.]
MVSKRHLSLFILVAGFATFGGLQQGGSSKAWATEISAEKDARNRLSFASRQSMLTQKIARNACFVMANIDAERYVAKTESTVRQFDNTVHGLRYGDVNLELRKETNADVLTRLEAVETLWRTLGAASRQIAAGDVHTVPMAQLILLNMRALSAMDDAVDAIEATYGEGVISPDIVETARLAGRQRVLSQKVSKEVCFLLIGVESAGNWEMVNNTVAEFDLAMTDLLNGAAERDIVPPPDRQIKKQLERTQKAWVRFKKLLEGLEENLELSPGDRIQLANLSDQALREMDLAVWMYTEQ